MDAECNGQGNAITQWQTHLCKENYSEEPSKKSHTIDLEKRSALKSHSHLKYKLDKSLTVLYIYLKFSYSSNSFLTFYFD